MPFATSESSVQAGRPVELFEIVYGRNVDSVYRYTDNPHALIVGGVTYSPLAISRNSSRIEGNGTQSDLTVTVPISSDLASLFVSFPPNVVVALVVRSGHLPDDADETTDIDAGEFVPSWAGYISESSRDGSEATLTCKAPVSDLELPGLSRFYQLSCGFPLYGTRCSASKAAATTTGTVASLTGSVIGFADASWQRADVDPADYIGGYIIWTGPEGDEFGAILDAGETQLTILGPLRGLDVGETISILLGCPRTLEACIRLHDNAVNYGGQPWIPTENPIRERNF